MLATQPQQRTPALLDGGGEQGFTRFRAFRLLFPEPLAEIPQARLHDAPRSFLGVLGRSGAVRHRNDQNAVVESPDSMRVLAGLLMRDVTGADNRRRETLPGHWDTRGRMRNYTGEPKLICGSG